MTMTKRELRLRQHALLVRSAQLRQQFQSQSTPLVQPFKWADQSVRGLRWLYRNPAWPGAALVALVIVRPQRALKWGGRLWWLWRSYKAVQQWGRSLPKR